MLLIYTLSIWGMWSMLIIGTVELSGCGKNNVVLRKMTGSTKPLSKLNVIIRRPIFSVSRRQTAWRPVLGFDCKNRRTSERLKSQFTCWKKFYTKVRAPLGKKYDPEFWVVDISFWCKIVGLLKRLLIFT